MFAIRNFRKVLSVGLVSGASVALLAGCTSDNGSSRSDDYDDDDVVLAGDDVIGTSGRPSSIPNDATLVESGKGELEYRAQRDGWLYAYDRGQRKLVWSGQVRSGEEFTIDPGDNIAKLDGRTVYDRDLKQDNLHELYFDAGRTRDYDPQRDNDRTRGRDRDLDGADLDRVPSEIPRDARLVESGSGIVDFTADDRGTVYAYDRDDDKLVYRGELRDGERFVLDADRNRARIDDNTVLERDLRAGNRYEIYFVRD